MVMKLNYFNRPGMNKITDTRKYRAHCAPRRVLSLFVPFLFFVLLKIQNLRSPQLPGPDVDIRFYPKKKMKIKVKMLFAKKCKSLLIKDHEIMFGKILKIVVYFAGDE